MRVRAMVQIIASNPISASTFRRGLAHRARANGASPRAPPRVPRRAPGRDPTRATTITYADSELTRASPPPTPRLHRRRRLRDGDPPSRRDRTPRAPPRRRPRGRAPRISRARHRRRPGAVHRRHPRRLSRRSLPRRPRRLRRDPRGRRRTRRRLRRRPRRPPRRRGRRSRRERRRRRRFLRRVPRRRRIPRRVLGLVLRGVGLGARRGPPRARRRGDGPLLGARPGDARRRPRRGWRGREGRAGGAGFLVVQPRTVVHVRRHARGPGAIVPGRRPSHPQGVRRHPRPAGALNERLMGAVGAAWFETLASAGGDKSAAFVWGGEKFAGLLVDTCVHRVLFRDEPAAAGNRLVADTLMTLQDLATARVPLSADATTVALSACRAFIDDINDADAPGRAAARLAAAAPASDTATETARAARFDWVGVPGTRRRRDSAWAPTTPGPGRFTTGAARGIPPAETRGTRRRREPQGWRLGLRGVRLHELRVQVRVLQVRRRRRGRRRGRRGVRATRFRGSLPRREDRFAPKPGDWTCPRCNFSNFASRVECKRCGEPGGGGGGGGGGGYGGGGWDRDAPAVRSWSDDRGDRGFDRGFDRGARYGRGAEGGSSRGYGGNRRSGGGGRGGGRGRGGRDRGGGWDDADAGGWNDGNGDAGFGGYW